MAATTDITEATGRRIVFVTGDVAAVEDTRLDELRTGCTIHLRGGQSIHSCAKAASVLEVMGWIGKPIAKVEP